MDGQQKSIVAPPPRSPLQESLSAISAWIEPAKGFTKHMRSVRGQPGTRQEQQESINHAHEACEARARREGESERACAKMHLPSAK